MLPLVYIIIVNWNGKGDTIECLHSLQHLSYQNYKILVVDNASTDGSVDAIRQNFSDIEFIVNKQNLRFAGGNNIGIHYALQKKADYYLLLNNDTVVEKKFLSELVTVAEREKEAGMFGAKIFYFSQPEILWYAGGTINLTTGWMTHTGIRKQDEKEYNKQREVDYITGCCLLVKQEVIKKIGFLDEAYYIYGEDADWCLRASNAGYKLFYVPAAILWHKISVSSGGNFSWFKNWNKLKSQLRFLFRYARWYYWLIIPITFPLGVIIGFLRAKKEMKDFK